ncbi:MAG: hypothetical protein ACYC5Y_02375 [Symbiobacteriia bacterium]
MSETENKDVLCFWCGMKPGKPATPGKIALCPDCAAELAPKDDASAFRPAAALEAI